jgi:hypothetical protein
VKKLFMLLIAVCAVCPLMSQPMTWGSPTDLSTAGVDSTDPQVAIDSNGNVTVVWVEGGLLKSQIYTSSSGLWSGILNVSNTGTASAPRLGVQSDGTVTAIWVQSGVVTTATFSGGSWGGVQSLSSSGATNPALAVMPNGNAVATWTRATFIEATTRVSGTWGLVLNVNTFLSFPNSDNSSVSVNASGTAIIAWKTVVSSADTIVSSSATVGGSWGAGKSVPQISGAFNHNFPKVVIDASGNANVLWYRSITTGSVVSSVQILSATLAAGSSAWAIPTVLSDMTLPSYLDPATLRARIGLDSNGNVVGLWTNSSDGATFNLNSAVKQANANWTPTIQIVTENLYAFRGDLAVNNYGDAILAAMFFDGSASSIVSSQSDFTGPGVNFWGTFQTVSSGTKNAYPRIASTSSSTTVNGAIAWINGDSGNNVIQASVGSKTILAPPTSLGVSQSSVSFGAFTDYKNTLTWTGSTDPNVTNYIIYRNGVEVEIVSASTFSYVDHNEVNGGSVVYGVAAIDSDLSQSVTATVSFP